MIPALKRRALRRDQRGVTAVEFALVAPVMLLMVMGFFDLAHRVYATAMLQGAMQKAARDSTLETASPEALDLKVKSLVIGVTGKAAIFRSGRLSYSDFNSVGQPERFIDAKADGRELNNRYDKGECFEDMNGNSVWDSDLGKTGNGGAQDAVLYTMRVTYPRLFPMAGLMGWPKEQEIKASTVLRNQPYGDQQARTPVSVDCS